MVSIQPELPVRRLTPHVMAVKIESAKAIPASASRHKTVMQNP
jgi:hypothetical protein